jgi:hypothetical protein
MVIFHSYIKLPEGIFVDRVGAVLFQQAKRFPAPKTERGTIGSIGQLHAVRVGHHNLGSHQELDGFIVRVKFLETWIELILTKCFLEDFV